MTLSTCVASMDSCGGAPLPCTVTVFLSQTMRSMSSHDLGRRCTLREGVKQFKECWCVVSTSVKLRNTRGINKVKWFLIRSNKIGSALHSLSVEIVVGRWLQKYWRRKRSVAIFRLTSSKKRECTTVVAGVDIGTASTSLVSPAVLDRLKNIAPLAGRCVVRNMCSLQ